MTDILVEAVQDNKSRRFKEAVAKYQRILEANPQNAIAHQGLGYSLIGLGRYNEALEACRRAIALNPNLAVAHLNLGYIYHVLKRYQQSEEELKLAIEVDPHLVEAYVTLGTTFIQQGRLLDAERILEKAWHLAPQNAAICHNLSLCYGAQRRYDDAEKMALNAYRLSPSLEEGWLLLSSYLEKHSIAIYPLLVILFLISSSVHSLLTLPVTIVGVALIFGGSIIYLQRKDWKRGMVGILIACLWLTGYLFWQFFTQ
jgi:tetratricopeptide (TPR) repeat protein